VRFNGSDLPDGSYVRTSATRVASVARVTRVARALGDDNLIIMVVVSAEWMHDVVGEV
jgi:hypothetical protein